MQFLSLLHMHSTESSFKYTVQPVQRRASLNYKSIEKLIYVDVELDTSLYEMICAKTCPSFKVRCHMSGIRTEPSKNLFYCIPIKNFKSIWESEIKAT